MTVQVQEPINKYIGNGSVTAFTYTFLVTDSSDLKVSYLFSDKSEKAVLTTQLQAISVQVAELRTDVRAIQSNFATKEEHLDHETRLRVVERRVLK